jgi:hypothetical protein
MSLRENPILDKHQNDASSPTNSSISPKTSEEGTQNAIEMRNTNKNIINKTCSNKEKSRTTQQHMDDSDSLIYSSTTSSTRGSNLRPSSTIRKNSDIDAISRDIDKRQWEKFFGNSMKKITNDNSRKPKKYSQIKLKAADTDKRPFGDDIHGDDNGVKIMFQPQYKRHQGRRKLAPDHDHNEGITSRHLRICGNQ